ncbi:uncharacterized protein LOC128221093 [Mya arenaria]|uniref:uncharacterized protein LOC128221093 n=1 Tax=Mya arenaria TaxID=6604 RepID=UPI0022E16920|nr:uncharacterized protein LOC128221093 [Mya arenaria]
MDGTTHFQTTHRRAFTTRYLKDGSFFLNWTATIQYNRSRFYASCARNQTIKTGMVSLNLTEIVGKCGALVLLNQVTRGAEIKLGYFPSTFSLVHETYTIQTWTKTNQDIHLREGYYEEENVSEYLYILTIFNFDKSDEGTYRLTCNVAGYTNSVQLQILGSRSQENNIQTLSSLLRFPVNNLLIGTGIFCGICILVVIGGCLRLQRRKVNTVNTIEIIEHHSGALSENDLPHITTQGVQYAVVQRPAVI